MDEAVRGVEDQRHGAAPVGHGEGARGDALLVGALNFASERASGACARWGGCGPARRPAGRTAPDRRRACCDSRGGRRAASARACRRPDRRPRRPRAGAPPAASARSPRPRRAALSSREISVDVGVGHAGLGRDPDDGGPGMAELAHMRAGRFRRASPRCSRRWARSPLRSPRCRRGRRDARRSRRAARRGSRPNASRTGARRCGRIRTPPRLRRRRTARSGSAAAEATSFTRMS